MRACEVSDNDVHHWEPKKRSVDGSILITATLTQRQHKINAHVSKFVSEIKFSIWGFYQR